MGAADPLVAVVDAGPLIHLAEIGSLHLLTIFSALHIPDAVWSEAVTHGSVPQRSVSALGRVQRHRLRRTSVQRLVLASGLQKLHAGERECLYLAQRLGVPILLTDDLAVRDAAKRLSLLPVGSLGVVVRAYRVGRFSLVEAERLIQRLQDVSSLFVTPDIVRLAIEQLRSGHG